MANQTTEPPVKRRSWRRKLLIIAGALQNDTDDRLRDPLVLDHDNSFWTGGGFGGDRRRALRFAFAGIVVARVELNNHSSL